MNILLDTQLLLWAAYDPERLSGAAVQLIEDRRNTLLFSAASIWEVSIKASLGREDFDADPWTLRRGLLDAGYEELPINGVHAAAVRDLPALHKDPFDRLLVAQARCEGVPLLTADSAVAEYGRPARLM